jgi:hypothetical protein
MKAAHSLQPAIPPGVWIPHPAAGAGRIVRIDGGKGHPEGDQRE